jgi:hypothetical protein
MVKLSDGRELTADMLKISIKEYRSLFKPDQPQEEEDTLVGKVYGLTVDEVCKLTQPDYRLIIREFFRAAKEPLADPNSQSASTST